ncbi:hypothetical protein [Kitasatospora sp. NPDC004272]
MPSLLPHTPYLLTFGMTTRPKISGWAQKTIGGRKLCKKKPGAATHLLALCTAAHSHPDGHTHPDGRLGHGQDGAISLDAAAAFCAVPPEYLAEHADLLIAADRLTEADTADSRLRGRLAERVWPLGEPP